MDIAEGQPKVKVRAPISSTDSAASQFNLPPYNANLLNRRMMTTTSVDQLVTINQASQKSEVPKSTLRYWERRFSPFLDPIRSPGGQRRYSEKQLSIIARIKMLKTQGLGLEEVRQALSQDEAAVDKPTKVVELEHLADRVARLVKQEVCRFFSEERNLERIADAGSEDVSP